MPILIVLIVFAALVWGAIAAFHAIAAQFGLGVAVGASCVAAVLIALALGAWWRSRREIARNTKEAPWTHAMRHGAVELKVSATQGLLWLSQDGTQASYTLTDVTACRAEQAGGGWRLAIALRDPQRAAWALPMPSQREARRWARVVTLAKAGKL